MIGIVIPYYQKEAGLLRRAIASVASQRGERDWHVYVVDDGSPAPAEDEIRDFPPDLTQRIHILRQRNAGPGAARNLALDSMPTDILTVAFLDSDDIWCAQHLENARTSLVAGADFYFADHRRDEDQDTRFTQCGFRADGARITTSNPNLRWCDTSMLFRAIIQRSPVGTSTIALRRSSVGTKRFPTNFRSAGEDSIFWLELLTPGVRIACSRDNEVQYGRGVSIFNHRSWGDERSMRTTLDQMRAQLYLRRNFKLDESLLAGSNAQCRNLDLAFCSAMIACGRRMQWAAALPAMAYARIRPLAFMQLPRAVFRALHQHGARAS
jgi:succinoglycan biosynthesis protein ExoW